MILYKMESLHINFKYRLDSFAYLFSGILNLGYIIGYNEF